MGNSLSRDEQGFLINTKVCNPCTKDEKAFRVFIEFSLALDRSGRPVLIPDPNMWDNQRKKYNPFLEISESLRRQKHTLAVNAVTLLVVKNDFGIEGLTIRINDFFSCTHRPSNIPLVAPRLHPVGSREEIEVKDYGDDSAPIGRNEVARKKEKERTERISYDPEITNTVLISVPETNVIDESGIDIMRSRVERSAQLRYGGLDALYVSNPGTLLMQSSQKKPVGEPTQPEEGTDSNDNADFDTKVSSPGFQVYSDSSPIVSDLHEKHRLLQIPSTDFHFKKESDKIWWVIQDEADQRLKEYMRDTVFKSIRYTDFSETSVECPLTEAQADQIQKVFRETMELHTVYTPSLTVILQVNCVRVLPGPARLMVDHIELE